MAKTNEQDDIVESGRGFGYSFGILMVIFLLMYIIEYFTA